MSRRNPRNAQTDTPAFRRWFGYSKVVDARGKPLVVYHGSSATFDTFDVEQSDVFGEEEPRALRHRAFFFTDDYGTASVYGSKVYAVYLYMERPLVADAGGAHWFRIPQTAVKMRGWTARDKSAARAFMGAGDTTTDEISELAYALGFDGVIIRNVIDTHGDDANDASTTVYAVFDPRQIKSATGNLGTFDPDDPSIYRNPRRGYTSAMRTDPELWEEVKAEVTRGSKGGLPGQWSARKAQLAVALYRSRGGDYYGPKSPYNALAKWTREKWRTKSGRPSLETGERYLPSAAIAALTPAEYAATTRAKRAGMKKGQQFVPQPEAVAKKVRRYRRNPRDPQTDTPAFRRWFGDSRVVDVRGGPLVVYHGSSKEDIEEFEVPRNRRRESIFFFSDERTVAQEYGDTVYPVYLRVLNPLVVDARGRDWASIPQSAVKFHGWEEDDVEAAKSIMDDRSDDGSTTSTDVIAHIASLYGFDGVIIRNVVDSASGDRDQPSTVYAVFDATNIKSATRNVGTYDPHSRNIYENPRRNPAQPEAVAKKVRRYRRNPVQDVKDENVHLKGAYGSAEDVFLKMVQEQFAENADLFFGLPEGSAEKTIRTAARRVLRAFGIDPKARAYGIDFLTIEERGKGSGSRIVGEIEQTLRNEGEQVVFLIAAQLFVNVPHSRGFWKRMGYTEVPGNYEPLVWEFGSAVEDDRIMFKVL